MPDLRRLPQYEPDSSKRDWRIGDVRGIQEISITQPIAANIFSFRFLLSYFALAGILAWSFIALQRRQARTIRNVNRQLTAANEFLSSISMKISRYLSPQIFKSIFSGEKDLTIHTERKKLSIFFSGIKDFTVSETLPAQWFPHLSGDVPLLPKLAFGKSACAREIRVRVVYSNS